MQFLPFFRGKMYRELKTHLNRFFLYRVVLNLRISEFSFKYSLEAIYFRML